jgi:nitroreductase
MTYVKIDPARRGDHGGMAPRNPNLLPPEKRPRLIDGWPVTGARFPADPIARLVYYARLAPSTHNSQPWEFVAGPSQIDVFADTSRWLPFADPERREMYLSLGCAIEALRIAADFARYGSAVSYFPAAGDETLVARVAIALGGPKREGAAADLLEPMVTRHTSRELFDPARPVSDEDRKRLYGCFDTAGVALHFLSERAALDALVEAERRADESLLANAGYRKELARAVGAGLHGTPWLLSKINQLVVGHLPRRAVVSEDAARLASAPLVALLSTRRDGRLEQVNAGEAFMRIALAAEKRNLRLQPVSQVLETAPGREEAARLFGLGERVPQHLFRLGHADPATKAAPRRPLESVLIRAG